MALIQDPDFLTRDTEVIFDTTNKTIQLVATGNLSTDGVTLQALYSFTKERWKADADLIRYPFPFTPITNEQFEFVNGWAPADSTTVNLIRSAGFAVVNTSGAVTAEYAGIITLGTLGPTDQVYFQQSDDDQQAAFAPTNIELTGQVNQAVQIYSDPNGDGSTVDGFDYRGVFNVFVREQAKTYADADLADIGVSSMTYQAYRFPLANSTDLKVTHDDTTADGYGVTITYLSTPETRTIGADTPTFDVIINGNGRTAEEIYEAVQSKLRKDANIGEAGGNAVNGKTAPALLTFVGDTLKTSSGVYIDNFSGTDTNRLEFFDVNGDKYTFPFVAAGTITFNSNLIDDGAAIFRMYYTDGFGTPSAVLVQDSSDATIGGDVPGSGVYSFSYDYDGDAAGGGAGIDKNVTVVAIGLNDAQYVLAQGTIGRSISNSISLVSSLERNYSNAE